MRRRTDNRRSSWFSRQWLLAKEMLRRSGSGYVLILTALLIPIVLTAVNYTVKLVQNAHISVIKTSSSAAVGNAALRAYNPGKTWTDQKAKVYSAGAQTLNDRSFDLNKSMVFSTEPTTVWIIHGQRNVSGFSMAKMYLALSSYGLTQKSGSQTYFYKYASYDKPITEHPSYKTLLCNWSPVDFLRFTSDILTFCQDIAIDSNVSIAEQKRCEIYYNPNTTANKNVLEMSLDTAKNCIKCNCKTLGKIAEAHPPKCDVDIILTIPTNHAACTANNSNSGTLVSTIDAAVTPLREIADSYAYFLRENFLHTTGVAVGLVPYSGKISIPLHRKSWTVNIPPLNKSPTSPYIKQAVAYGTDGQEGGEIVSSYYQYQMDDNSISCPLMFRKGGRIADYRGVEINTGYNGYLTKSSLLLSVDQPLNDYRFQLMNPNPCYLGHCNLLASTCEKTCPTHMANPYFISELTDDVQNVIYDLSLFYPINDTKNKSNFIFLAVQWAQNLLSSWTSHPTCAATSGEKFAHPERGNKKRAVIIIVNAPDHFEHGELTYLGFSNDNSEIPMHESDTILFFNNVKKGAKGIIQYSGAGSYNSDQKSFEITGADQEGTLTFPEKGVLKLVVALANPSITFYNNSEVSSYKNNGTTYALNSTTTNREHKLAGQQDFIFSGPADSVYNLSNGSKVLTDIKSTGGVNFGHNLSLYKLKYKLKESQLVSGTLSNQILRAYGYYGDGKALITSGISSSDRAEAMRNSSYEKFMDPCIGLQDGAYNTTSGWSFSSGNNFKILAYDFQPKCYGVQYGKFIMAANWIGNAVTSSAQMRTSSGAWSGIGTILNGNKYSVFAASNSPYSTDCINISTGKFTYKSQEIYTKTYTEATTSSPETSGGSCKTIIVCDYECSGGQCSCTYPNVSCPVGSSCGSWSLAKYTCEWRFDNYWKGIVQHCDGYIYHSGCNYSRTVNYKYTRNFNTNGTAIDGAPIVSDASCQTLYSPYRYDLNNFFFVNGGTKSYDSSKTYANAVKNECIASVTSGSDTWLCFCGDGELNLKVKPLDGYLKFTNINNISGINIMFDGTSISSFSNNTSYKINESGETVFYLSPDQISDSRDANGNYQVKFKMTKLKIISAEISNRPTETITPTCSLSGTTNALGKSNQNAVITTNMKAPLTISAKTESKCSVTFYNDNEVSNYSSNGTDYVLNSATPSREHAIGSQQDFIFSGPADSVYNLSNGSKVLTDIKSTGGVNFGHNLSLYKLKYKLKESQLVSGTLSNQILRAYGYYGDGKALITSGISSSDRAEAMRNSSYEKFMDPCIGLQDGAYNTTSGWSFSSSNNFKILAYDFQPKCYGVQYGKFIMAANWTGASVRKSLPGVRSDLERFEYRFLGVENAAIVNLFLSIESLAIHLATSPTNEGLKTEFSRALARLSPYSISKSQEAVDIGSISGGNKYNVFDFFLPSARYSQNPLYYILYVYYPPSTVYSQISTGHFNYKSQEAVTASYTYSCEASDSRVGIYDAKNTCNAGYGNTVTTDFRNGISISYFKCFCDQSCASGWTYEGNGTSFFNHTATEGCNCNYTFSRACYNYFDTNGTKTGSSCPSDITQNVTASTYSPYRYDLNNFFFVNGETKSYDSSKTYANAVKNECIASVTSGSDTWLCFCGDGQLNISIRPTGVISGTMTYKNASNATVSTSVTNLSNQTINIDPSTHLYEAQGDGTYKITLTLTNVQISNPKMSNITSTIRHSHINIVADNLKNTNIVDFNKNVSGKPQYYGSITFGNDGNGGSLSTSSYSYSNIDHLKYWTNNSSAINGFYHQNIVGDFFAIIWDYNNLSPSINWSLNTGTDFGTYNNSYSFSGFHRSFFPWGVFTNQSQKYANFTSGNVALILGGFTLPLNYALCNNGYQASASTAVPSSTLDPDAAVISVAGDACDKLKAVADARVYLIKYRTTDTNLGNSKTALSKCAYGSSSPYIQTASNRDELVSALNAVAKDIKEFANHEDQYVEEK